MSPHGKKNNHNPTPSSLSSKSNCPLFVSITHRSCLEFPPRFPIFSSLFLLVSLPRSLIPDSRHLLLQRHLVSRSLRSCRRVGPVSNLSLLSGIRGAERLHMLRD
ncbi:hypothetical protein CEXT_335931 [Caerostris extrusa]|uniref:Uncharacterized protein n=1 Tax=Caerostris extrusa TaxID=172846 RepID=A0AAV4TWH1_CAEEX|nr:hypothetical protein CEXT_335931 [Caerostris extrusa]